MKNKLILTLILIVSVILILSYCQRNYSDNYVRWGDTIENVDLKKLERNNIPYKINNDKVFIPEDAVNKAVYCCT